MQIMHYNLLLKAYTDCAQQLIQNQPRCAHTACLHLQLTHTLPLQPWHWQLQLTSCPESAMEEATDTHMHNLSHIYYYKTTTSLNALVTRHFSSC